MKIVAIIILSIMPAMAFSNEPISAKNPKATPIIQGIASSYSFRTSDRTKETYELTKDGKLVKETRLLVRVYETFVIIIDDHSTMVVPIERIEHLKLIDEIEYSRLKEIE